jgi:carboxypeptidase Taq
MSDPARSYQQLLVELKETALLSSTGSLLHWDERTLMPPKGAEHRANQVALIARLAHERFTSPRVGDLLAEVEASDLVRDPLSPAAVNAREARWDYSRATRLPPSLVEELSRTEVLGQQAWVEARKASRYDLFEPWLTRTLELKKQQAECLGYTGTPYNALLEEFEPGESADGLRRVFESLRGPLVDLVGRVSGSSRRPPVDLLNRDFPVPALERLCRDAAGQIGFDFDAGRLDVSVHPFCADIGPGDVRLTTRYTEGMFGAFFGVLHEAGHGLYEQGLPSEHYGTPRGRSVSLGIHESQSRMWENLVGRSRSFWGFFWPRARQALSGALADVDLSSWLAAVNQVSPSLIRVEADEATYNLHILLRFELEVAMMQGDLSPRDVPGAWNEKTKKYLGLTPPDDAHGCLQDIHWSGGAIGYFPTYTLGNLYAAQFFEQARRDLGDLDAQFARGEFGGLLGWLRSRIHGLGRTYRPRDLLRHVTGQDLSAQPLLRHLSQRAAMYYGV